MSTVAVLAQESGGSSFGLLFLLLGAGAIVAFTFLPQRRQKAKQAEFLKALSVGDEVVSIGGIHGIVNHIEDDVVHLEVDDDVVIKIELGAVSRKAEEPDSASPAARPRGGFLSALTGGGAEEPGGSDAADGDAPDSGEDDVNGTDSQRGSGSNSKRDT